MRHLPDDKLADGVADVRALEVGVDAGEGSDADGHLLGGAAAREPVLLLAHELLSGLVPVPLGGVLCDIREIKLELAKGGDAVVVLRGANAARFAQAVAQEGGRVEHGLRDQHHEVGLVLEHGHSHQLVVALVLALLVSDTGFELEDLDGVGHSSHLGRDVEHSGRPVAEVLYAQR